MNNDILCVRRDDCPATWTQSSVSVPMASDDLSAALNALPPQWIDRPLAEEDPSHKQLIMYCLITDGKGRFAAYPRHGDEARLHDRWSVGLGGHVDREDEGDTITQTLMNSLTRELCEELQDFDPATVDISLQGLVNDETNLVGEVHLGIICLAVVNGDTLPQPGEELAGLKWITCEEANEHNLEGWSTLALACLASKEL